MNKYKVLLKKDKEPTVISEELMKTEEDVRKGLKKFRTMVLDSVKKDISHSIGYLKTIEALFQQFQNDLMRNRIPPLTSPWWYYSFSFDNEGLSMYLNHMEHLSFEEEDGKVMRSAYSHDGVYKLVDCPIRKLTVEEYAEKFGVEPVTVRQWIRRGKIRNAIKTGNEWRISELSDLPDRGFKRAAYSVKPSVVSNEPYPDEYSFLKDAIFVYITKNEEDSSTFKVLAGKLGGLEKSTEKIMTTREREKFELFLITRDEFVFQDKNYSSDTISGKDWMDLFKELLQKQAVTEFTISERD